MNKPVADGKFKLDSIASICVLATVSISFLVIVGWIVGLRFITSISPRFIPMAPSTAVLFLILSCTLFIFHKKIDSILARSLISVLSITVFLAAMIILLEFFGVIRADIEKIFVRGPKLFQGLYEGRMSSITALSFLSLSLCLFISGLCRQKPRILSIFVQCCIMLVFLSASIILLSYIYGAPFLYGKNLIPMALNTNIAFILLSVAFMILIDSDFNPLCGYLAVIQ